MNIVKLNNLGFNTPSSDIDANSLPPEVFSNAFNFRSFDDKFVSFSGKSLISLPPSNIFVGNAIHFLSGGTSYYITLGRSICRVFNGTSWYDITPASLSMSIDQELAWTVDMLGSIPIVNNPNFAPLYWSPQSITQVLLPLNFDAGQTWLAKGFSAKVIRAHRNFLFALNLTESSVEFPYSYRWSHPADTNGLPPSWDETDLSYIASKESISGSGGPIVDGRSLRDAFCIYSERAITVLDFVGGEFIWQARSLSSSYGLAAIDTVVEVKGTNIFLSDGDILINDGNSLSSILTNKLRRRLASTISSTKYQNSFALSIPTKSEVWFFLVEEGSVYPSIVYIYNWSSNVVSLREVSGIVCGMYGPKPSADDSWNSGSSGTFDSQNNAWNDVGFSPFGFCTLGVGQLDSAIYNLEETTGNFDTVLERTNFTPGNLDEATTIVALYPKIQSSGDVLIEIGSQQQYDGPVAWKSPITFTPSDQRRVALRTTGKFHSWKISSIGNHRFSMSGMDIEYLYAGKR